MDDPAGESDLGRDDTALLALLARGATGAELARQLGVNPRTVQRRIDRVRRALGTETTIQAVVEAIRRGLI